METIIIKKIQISGFGKTGCNEAMPEGEDGFFQKALNSVNRFAKMLGFN